MDWIQEYLDINDKTLKKIFTKCPSIVGQNLTTLEGKMKYYQETLGWSIKDVATVMTTSRIITLSTEFNIEPKRQWLSNTFNATKNDISKLIKKNPGLLSANVDDMVDRLEFLQDQLELHSSEAKQKLVWKVPCALALTKDTLNSKVTWFQSSSLGLTKREMAKAIRSRPTLLTSSIEMNLEPSLKWLNDRFGQAAARKMIMSNPPILGYSISEKIEPRLDYLEGTFGLNDTELSIMVCKLPSILGLNQASLEEKLQFYATCVGSRPETLEFISRNPRLLSASLDKRLIPRWEQVLEFKLPERGFRVPMLTMACYPSAQWEKYLARRKMLILESQQTLK
ncbi:mitochondrial transcription termination [Seminavis robusta]|uniref:Mitochondrial transcription termination n=1 Tax=Seminavis robusta TaxID=568900 RepID=A0A9N8H2B3_9STRA|nr:mitochondrial transcription termination [Seminavis robusta]|eukprot:Sro32_g021130.1 mitochondrial transcription termination (339) ;mRNA; f:157934-158950